MSSLVISALAVNAVPALAVDVRVDGSDEMAKAVERDLGLDQAKAQDELQQKAIALNDELQKWLGDAFAGSQYDLKSGRLIVMVSDKELLEQADAAGADARFAAHSLRKLEAIQAELDGGGVPGRERDAKTQPAPFAGWYIDSIDNAVRVTATRAQAGAAKELQAKYGDAVTIELSENVAEPTGFMDGGDLINDNTCSAGFNLRDPSTGQEYLPTAGHCVSAGSSLKGQGGVTFGTVLESWFPVFDDSITRKSNAFWIQGPWVDTNPSNGGFINTTGHSDLPPGFPICKSGITTEWTCGIITAKNQTVTYTGGRTVFGLTRHNACVEPGDSGGANVSIFAAIRAEGITSGASLVTNPFIGKQECGAKWGLSNVSRYFPIADSLAYYGSKYGVTTW